MGASSGFSSHPDAPSSSSSSSSDPLAPLVHLDPLAPVSINLITPATTEDSASHPSSQNLPEDPSLLSGGGGGGTAMDWLLTSDVDTDTDMDGEGYSISVSPGNTSALGPDLQLGDTDCEDLRGQTLPTTSIPLDLLSLDGNSRPPSGLHNRGTPDLAELVRQAPRSSNRSNRNRDLPHDPMDPSSPYHTKNSRGETTEEEEESLMATTEAAALYHTFELSGEENWSCDDATRRAAAAGLSPPRKVMTVRT